MRDLRASHTRPAVWLLSAALALTGTCAVAAPAGADPTGTISGAVTGPDSLPLDAVEVTAYAWNATRGQWQSTGIADRTDAAGAYAITGLAAGQYRLRFWDYSPHHYLTEFWDDAATVETATNVPVVAGEVSEDRDAQLVEGGHVTGTVTGPGGRPADVQVTAYRWNPTYQEWRSFAITSTDGAGRYDLSALPTATYRVGFQDRMVTTYTSEYWDNATSVETATDIPVTASQTSGGHDAELAAIGRVAGTVTGPGGMPLPGILVNAYYWNANDRQWTWDGSGRTAANGDYDLAVRMSGRHRLWFADDSASDAYLSEYWNDAATIETATDVMVSAGVTTADRDAELAPASISGAPVVGAEAVASTTSWTEAGLPLKYQWYVDGDAVNGATEKRYVPRARDAGKSLKVKVKIGDTDTATSAAKQVGKGALHATKAPHVNGKLKRGATLRLVKGTWSAAKTRVAVRWYAGRTLIGKGTRLELRGKTARAVAGKRITVRLKATAAGYRAAQKTLKVRGTLR